MYYLLSVKSAFYRANLEFAKIVKEPDNFVQLSGWTELSDTFIFHNSLKMNYLFKLKLTLKLVLPLT